jgi:hypothetical protein
MEEFQTEVKEPIFSSVNLDDCFKTDVEGRWAWPIRIASFILFAITVAVNYVIGLKTGAVSDAYHLYITPPGMFFLIWAAIYTALAVVNLYNLISNVWTKKTHLFFAISNVLNTLWIVVFNIGNNAAVFACSFILLAIVPILLKTWYALGERSPKSFDAWTYITRNVIAFYLGWVIAAANLNLGIDIVYWWNANKETQLAVFWVMAPLCAIAATAFNYVQEGRQGLQCCFMLWASVIWAFTGAAITSNGCLTGTLSLC